MSISTLCRDDYADLVLRRDSPYHLSLSQAEKGEETENDEWGGVSFDSVEALGILAGARRTLTAEAGEEIWTEV